MEKQNTQNIQYNIEEERIWKTDFKTYYKGTQPRHCDFGERIERSMDQNIDSRNRFTVFWSLTQEQRQYKIVKLGAPEWLSRLNVWLLISGQIMISHEIEPSIRLCPGCGSCLRFSVSSSAVPCEPALSFSNKQQITNNVVKLEFSTNGAFTCKKKSS